MLEAKFPSLNNTANRTHTPPYSIYVRITKIEIEIVEIHVHIIEVRCKWNGQRITLICRNTLISITISKTQ